MIYFARQDRTDLVKIGYTYGAPSRRLSELQTGQPGLLHLMGLADGDEATERGWHARFASSRVRGEWFRITPPLACSIALANPLLREFFAFCPELLPFAADFPCRPASVAECPVAVLSQATPGGVLYLACEQITAACQDASSSFVDHAVLVEDAILALGHPCFVPGCTCATRDR